MDRESDESRILRERYAGRKIRNQERITGAIPTGGGPSFRGTPYPGEVTHHHHYVAGFKYMVERARALRLSQEASISPPLRTSPSSDSGQSTPASPTQPTIQGRRRLPALPSTKPWCRSPPDNTAAYEPGVGAGESPATSPTPADTSPSVSERSREYATTYQQTKQPTLSEWSEVAAQFKATARDRSRMFERYIASLKNTLKELRPCLAAVQRTLDRLNKRLGPVGQPKPWAVDRPDTQPRVVPTPVTVNKQGTIIRYLVRKSENGTYRKEGAQPMPPREAHAPDGPDTPPSEVATSRGQSPETVDWGVALNGCQVDWGAASEMEESPTRPTENEQPSNPSAPDDADSHRESRAQPTPLAETPGANGPGTKGSD